jgi:hypothetical protein
VSHSHRRWRRRSAPPRVASAKGAPVGTTFRFALNESARVRFAFTQKLAGRRVGGHCVALTAKNKSKPRCSRIITIGTLRFTAGAGAHSVRFQGRVSKRRQLPLGRYTLIITASNTAGEKATARLTFTIVKG